MALWLDARRGGQTRELLRGVVTVFLADEAGREAAGDARDPSSRAAATPSTATAAAPAVLLIPLAPRRGPTSTPSSEAGLMTCWSSDGAPSGPARLRGSSARRGVRGISGAALTVVQCVSTEEQCGGRRGRRRYDAWRQLW